MTKLLITAAALALLAQSAHAACPTFEPTVRGTDGNDTLTGRKAGEPTKFIGGRGRDRFVVENPQHFAFSGCTERDHWDEILDFQDRSPLSPEIIDVPVEDPRLDRLTRIISSKTCYVYWQDDNYAILRNCPSTLTKADVAVR